jgi:hypothetical protein
VIVSAWSQQGHKERQFTPPHALGGMQAFPAWMVNVLTLEGRVAESPNEAATPAPSSERAA